MWGNYIAMAPNIKNILKTAHMRTQNPRALL